MTSNDLWRARSLVIVTKFDQNWFMHFGPTLDYVVDRKKEFKRNRTQAKFACVKKKKKEETRRKQYPAAAQAG